MRTLALALSCSLLVACGAEEEEDTTEDTPAPEAITPEEVTGEDPPQAATAGSYSLHEWGVVDVDLGDGSVEYAAGPGSAVEATTPVATGGGGGTTSASNGSGSGNDSNDDRPNIPQNTDQAVDQANSLIDQMEQATGQDIPIQVQRPRKPVVYFHLADPSQPVTIDLNVTIPNGRVVEHFPAGTLAEHGVRWSQVQIAGTSCNGGPYPTADGPACQGVADGYCEAAELSGYVANDAGCLTVGGAQQNFLFYRGDGTAPTLPLTITRADDGTVRISNEGIAQPVGPILRMRRGDDGAIQVSLVALPAQGSAIVLGMPADPANDDHREAVRDQLQELGLSGGEAQAFENAWFGELFDGEAETPHAFTDAVFFFLPSDGVDGFVRLEATPAPSTAVRAMAIRAGWR